MKKQLLSTCIALSSLGVYAQSTADSVSIEAGYANQTWYSLENGTLESAPKNEWDLAFEINGFASSIRVNHVNGNELWVYPHGDTADWNAVDTAGIESWPLLINSDTSWARGAFNVNAEIGNDFDLGWGVYNMVTHHVVGDSIYVINHNGTYKKLWIVSLASGAYTFRLADLNGSNEIVRSLQKTAYPEKNFGYYSIANDAFLDREPVRQNWDLLFTQYAAIIPNFGGYPSTGVLQNNGVKVAKVYPVEDTETYVDYESADFQTEINSIGYGWKSINMSTFQWDIADSTVYFVESMQGAIWKLVFTEFGGSANGNYFFTKEKIVAEEPEGIADQNDQNTLFEVYPNPVAGGVMNVVFQNSGTTQLTLCDSHGRLVRQQQISSEGLQTHTLHTSDLPAGLYFLTMQADGSHF
ncbi:MAG: T9SS type A sorting domain-containing protein [Salibacteraceae bacterium]